jgi:hypothetical protein
MHPLEELEEHQIFKLLKGAENIDIMLVSALMD